MKKSMENIHTNVTVLKLSDHVSQKHSKMKGSLLFATWVTR